MLNYIFFNVIKIILLSVALLLSVPYANCQSRTVRKAEKHKEKVDRQEEKKYNKSKEKAIEAHYDRQSDKTKEQMKQSKKNAKKFDSQKKDGIIEGFLKERKAKKGFNKRSKSQKRR